MNLFNEICQKYSNHQTSFRYHFQHVAKTTSPPKQTHPLTHRPSRHIESILFQNQQVRCERRQCPQPLCSNPARSRDSCCPVCGDCEYDNRYFYNRQRFANPLDRCEVCTCEVCTKHYELLCACCSIFYLIPLL